MKRIIFPIFALLVLLSACKDKTPPSTTPLHPSETGIVPTNEDEMTNLVHAMTDNDEWHLFMTEGLLSLMDEASHLTLANRDSVAYTPFNWNCKIHANEAQEHNNAIEKVNIGEDSVTIDMLYTDAANKIAYTLVMRYTKGHWCIDDIKWTGKEAPADTERHIAQAYIDDAVNQLTTTDAGFMVANRIKPIADACKNNPSLAENAIKDIETAHNYLKQNRGYTPELEQDIAEVLQEIKAIK